MSQDVASLVVEVKSDQAVKADKRLKKLGGTGSKVTGQFKRMAGAAKAFGIAAGVATAAMGLMVRKQIDVADNLQKLSIRLGESTEALSQYAHVADITGVSFEDVANAFSKMQKNLSYASDGIGTAKNALEKLNINVADLIDLRPSEQFEALADAIQKIESPAKRTQIAMDLMGRSGSRMLSTMAEGGAGIRKLREEFDAMGGTLSQVDANQLADTNDALTRMADRFDIFARTLTIAVGPAIKDMAKSLTDSLGVFVEFNKQLQLFFATHSYNEFGLLTNELKELEGAIDRSNKRLVEMAEIFGGTAGSERLFNQEIALLARLTEQAEKLRLKSGISKGPLEIAITEGVGPTQEEILAQQEFNVRENERRIAEVKKLYRSREEAEAKKHIDKLISFEHARTNAIIGLATELGKKSKAFAIAAFVAEKAIAIQRIIISSNVAAAAALTPPPIGLGPVAGIALAAKIKAAGYITAGAVGLTSIAEGISTFGGGGVSSNAAPSIGGGSAGSDSAQSFGAQPVQQAPSTNITNIYLGDEKVAEVVTHGLIVAQDRDMIRAETADKLETVRFA